MSALAQTWYVPARVDALKQLLPAAVLVNMVVLGGEVLRDSDTGMAMTVTGMLLLVLLRWLLPDGKSAMRRYAAQLLAVAVVVVALFSFARTGMTVYDAWSRAWLLVHRSS